MRALCGGGVKREGGWVGRCWVAPGSCGCQAWGQCPQGPLPWAQCLTWTLLFPTSIACRRPHASRLHASAGPARGGGGGGAGGPARPDQPGRVALHHPAQGHWPGPRAARRWVRGRVCQGRECLRTAGVLKAWVGAKGGCKGLVQRVGAV